MAVSSSIQELDDIVKAPAKAKTKATLKAKAPDTAPAPAKATDIVMVKTKATATAIPVATVKAKAEFNPWRIITIIKAITTIKTIPPAYFFAKLEPLNIKAITAPRKAKKNPKIPDSNHGIKTKKIAHR